MSEIFRNELERAWNWRVERGFLPQGRALRIFHGPGEGTAGLAAFAIDLFGSHCWVTRWDEAAAPAALLRAEEEITSFLKSKGIDSAVGLWRPKKGVPEEPRVLFGSVPEERFEVDEEGARFWIRLTGARHPGLFLDHLPLRRWLRARARGWKVLNTFAYTGSLSVAAGLGSASHVTTLDLSKPTVRWAEENWALNGLAAAQGRFLSGDVFEWLPRLKREGERYDCIILDPPSFSRGNKGSFSTAQDLAKLHGLAMDLLASEGVLATSINSAQVTRAKFASDVLEAARARKLSFDVLSEVDLPETFPTRLDRPADRYLKGWVLRRIPG